MIDENVPDVTHVKGLNQHTSQIYKEAKHFTGVLGHNDLEEAAAQGHGAESVVQKHGPRYKIREFLADVYQSDVHEGQFDALSLIVWIDVADILGQDVELQGHL